LAIYVLAITTVVLLVVFIANQLNVKLISLLASHSLDRYYACNNLFGARALFWTLWLGDFASVAAIVSLRRSKGDIASFQARARKFLLSGQEKQGQYMRLKLALLVFSILAYWGSYHLAYANQGLCIDKLVLLKGLDYVYIAALSLLRGMCLISSYLLYFVLIASPHGNGGPG